MVVRVYMYLIGNSNALVEGIPVHNEHYAKCHATFALTADIIQAASFNVTIRNEPAPPRAHLSPPPPRYVITSRSALLD